MKLVNRLPGFVLAAALVMVTTMTQSNHAAEDRTFVNSAGMTMVRLEAGEFVMGDDDGEWDEAPAHPVTISRPFHVSATEVTNAQYEQFDPEHRTRRHGRGGDDAAVVNVSWHEAVAFCRWLSEKEGRPYRLPTEAEWEYACRAGTTSDYHTGDLFPEPRHKTQVGNWNAPGNVDLTTAMFDPNPWGLYDMHGNVEEWCYDWYGPYEPGEQTDPVGRADGQIRVIRGGGYTRVLAALRSANRQGSLPGDRTPLVGFRVVQAPLPETPSLPATPPRRVMRNVDSQRHDWSAAPRPDEPLFRLPIEFVKPPVDPGEPFFGHNHDPDITACPNGDLLAIWYSTNTEASKDMVIVGSRLRAGAEQWEPASLFWDAPDRNDHSAALHWDGRQTLYHYQGMAINHGWQQLVMFLRTSTDSGASWSDPIMVSADYGPGNQVISNPIGTRDGRLIVLGDVAAGLPFSSMMHVSGDGGQTWQTPGPRGRWPENLSEGDHGRHIAGIHAGIVELEDGRLMALGRGNDVDGRMPMSVSDDGGKTWRYQAAPFPPVGSGQRLVLLRLNEGPILLVSFANAPLDGEQAMLFQDADGNAFPGTGMFAALTMDEGRTWPIRKLITPGDGQQRRYDGGGNTGPFEMTDVRAEPRGYLAIEQTPDGVIHLISSKLHYRFNLAWLKTPPPAPRPAP